MTGVSSQLTQTAVTTGIIVIKLIVTRIAVVALLIATMTIITKFGNILKSTLATPLTQANITVATGNGFEYGSQTINDDDNTRDEYRFESNEVFAATNVNVNRDVLSIQLIGVGAQCLDVFDKIYQNWIIFDILENENAIGFESFNCCNEYGLHGYQSSFAYPRPTLALTHQPIIIINRYYFMIIIIFPQTNTKCAINNINCCYFIVGYIYIFDFSLLLSIFFVLFLWFTALEAP